MFATRFCHLLCACLLIPSFARVAAADPIEEENDPKPSQPATPAPEQRPTPTPTPAPTPTPEPVPAPGPILGEPVADPLPPTDDPAVDPAVVPAEPAQPAPEPVVEPAPVEPVAEPTPAEPPAEELDPVSDALPLVEKEKEETRLRLGGLKGGLNAGRFVGKIKGEGINFGLALGAFLRLEVMDRLVLQPEFLMTDKGSDVKGLTETMEEALLFVEVPLLLRYDFHRSGEMRFYGLGGPSVAYLIDANTVPEEERATVDLAVHAGLGFEMCLANHDVNLELRGGQGIRNLMRDGSGLTARSTMMSLYVGISL